MLHLTTHISPLLSSPLFPTSSSASLNQVLADSRAPHNILCMLRSRAAPRRLRCTTSRVSTRGIAATPATLEVAATLASLCGTPSTTAALEVASTLEGWLAWAVAALFDRQLLAIHDVRVCRQGGLVAFVGLEVEESAVLCVVLVRIRPRKCMEWWPTFWRETSK